MVVSLLVQTTTGHCVGLAKMALNVWGCYGKEITALHSRASRNGDVIVGVSGTLGDFEFHDGEFFRWTAAEGMVGLGVLAGPGLAVSADGQFIVGSKSTELVPEAFIWDSVNGARPISDMLAGVGEAQEWQLTGATAISNDGTVIVGNGTNPDGIPEAWRVVVPEPSSAFVFACGCVALLFFRCKKQPAWS